MAKASSALAVTGEDSADAEKTRAGHPRSHSQALSPQSVPCVGALWTAISLMGSTLALCLVFELPLDGFTTDSPLMG